MLTKENKNILNNYSYISLGEIENKDGCPVWERQKKDGCPVYL